MQLTGREKIVLFGVALFVACALGFGAGVLSGRQFPAHRFERFGETKYLFDTTTGKVCDPFKDPNVSTNPFDHLMDQNGSSNAKNPSDSSDPFAAYGGHAVAPPPGYVLDRPTAPAYPPTCGK